ncbi:GNVR domain-containing protein [Candidatus Omnitrophota bacterium]
MSMNMMEESKPIRWEYYVGVGWRWKWVILLPAVLGLLIGIFLANHLPEIYEANSLISIEGGEILNPLMGKLAVAVDPAQRVNEIRHKILSWPRLVQLIEKLDLDQFVKGQREYEKLIEHLKKKIVVDFIDKEQRILSVAYRGKNAQRAQDIVVSLTDIIIERNLDQTAEDADSAISFISEQLEHYRTKLEESEEQLRKFQEVYTVQLPVITELNDQLVDLQIQLNSLLIENTERHPAVIAISKKIAQVKGDITRESKQLLRRGVDISEEKYLDIAESVPKQQQEYTRLMRDRKVNESIYQSLLEKFESAKISKQLDGAEDATKFKVIEPARLPIFPIAPDKQRIIMIGFALGLCLGCGIIALKEFINTSYKSVDEAKDLLDIPILGTISVINSEKPEKHFYKYKKKRKKEARKKASA